MERLKIRRYGSDKAAKRLAITAVLFILLLILETNYAASFATGVQQYILNMAH